MADSTWTDSEKLAFRVIYVFPWSFVCIVAILWAWKPEQLKYYTSLQFEYWGVDLRTMAVTTAAILAPFAVITLGVKAYECYKERRNAEERAQQLYEEEREALINLFESLDGENWYNKTRWCSDEPIERWHGVKLDPMSRRVNKLILPENRLGGTIPEGIGKLQGLIEIDFRRNNIGGEIPKALLTLSRLEGLYLFENNLEGDIPFELGDLPHLMGIYLFNNHFKNHSEAATYFREKLPEECHVFI